jgi:serine protease
MLILPARADQPKPPTRPGRPSRPTSPRALLLSSLSIALLVACGADPIKVEYRLDNILPSPVTPGEAVTAFGLLPENATLSLDGTPISGSSVPDGLSFKVPNSTTAGDHTIRLDAGETHLEASLSIKPRVDSVSLDGTILRLTGAGWGTGSNTGSGTGSGTQTASLSSDTRVLIDGLEYAPSVETNPNGSATGVTPSSNETNPSPVMRISLPERLPYGSFSVIVRVGDRSSAPLIVSREAGSISGTVSLPAITVANSVSPAGSSGLRLQSTGLPVSKVDASSVIVQFNSAFDQSQWSNRTAQLGTEFQAALNASLETESLPSLRVSRLRFASASQAHALVAQLGRVALASGLGVSKVSLDLRVKPSDAFKALNVPAPTDPSLTEPGTTPITTPATTPATLTRLEPGQGQWFLNLEGIPNAWNAGLPPGSGTATSGNTNAGTLGSGAPARGDGIVVAVIDTGVDLEHPDLKANLLPGWDFIDDDNTAQDIAGHGTHVAGLIAANGLVKGVAPNAKLLPVRVLRDLSGGTAFPVAQGILWAAGLLETPMVPKNPNPARVINLSLGSDEYNDLIAAAISSAMQSGVTVIAAAGNNGGSLAYPAALPGVVAVTALAGPKIAYQPFYASRGSGLWVTAYGGDSTQDQDGDRVMDGVLSTDLKAGINGAPGTSGYGLRMGTSMASPQVAGLAALALSSGTPNFLLRSALANNTSDIGPLGFDARFGHGLISGRIATPGAPRAYVLAFTGTPQRVAGSNQLAPKLLGWTLVQPDGSYQLNNLPTGSGLKLIAATDANANGLLGEAGEFASLGQAVVPVMGKVTSLSVGLELQPSSGLEVLRLQ